MRPLRCVPVELLAGEPGKSRAHEHRLPRGNRRIALGGELKIIGERNCELTRYDDETSLLNDD